MLETLLEIVRGPSAGSWSVRRGMGGRPLLILGWLLCAGVLSGCDGGRVEASTRLVVAVQSELPFGREIAALRVRALDPDDPARDGDRQLRLEAPEGASEVKFEVHRGSLERIRLEVVGLNGAGEDLVAQRMDVRFAANCSLNVAVRLRTGCRERLCEMNSTCGGPAAECGPVPEMSGLSGVVTANPGQRCDSPTGPSGAGGTNNPPSGTSGNSSSGTAGDEEPPPPANACGQPGSTRCPEEGTNRVQYCDLRDGVWIADVSCGDAEVCRETGEGDTYCARLPAACLGAEGEARCDGSNLVRCDNPDTWENPMRCANPRLCEMGLSEGTCRQCETGEEESARQVRCTSAGVEICNAEGTDYTLKEACEGDTHCDETARKCITGLCDPMAFYCAGDTLQRCNGEGDGYERIKQCDRGLCSAADGACRVCEPGARRCEADDAFVCSEDGSQWNREPCGEPTRFCVGNGICVACTNNDQCETDDPCLQSSCNTGRGRCTDPIPADGACRQADNSAGFCNDGQCVECARSSQCGSDLVCRDSRCVECGVNADCGLGRQCVANTCVECMDSSDCLEPNSCAPRVCQDNRCVDGTADDVPSQCALAEGGAGRCNPNRECVQCLTDGDCSMGTPFCGSLGTCIQCLTSADCESGVCAPGGTCGDCEIASDCPSLTDCKGFECRDRACIPVDFEPGRSCSLFSEPTPGVCNGTGECVECVDDSQCPGGGVCSGGECVQCVDAADCGPSGECLLRECRDNLCRETALDGDEACTTLGGESGFCVAGDCRGCRDDDTCARLDPAAPFCESGTCVECRGRDGCPPDTACETFQCSSGRCVGSPGGTCATAGGVCIEDTCCGDGDIAASEACDPNAIAEGWSTQTCNEATCEETFLAPCERDADCGGADLCLDGRCQFNCSDATSCPSIPGRPPLICDGSNHCALPDAGVGAP